MPSRFCYSSSIAWTLAFHASLLYSRWADDCDVTSHCMLFAIDIYTGAFRA